MGLYKLVRLLVLSSSNTMASTKVLLALVVVFAFVALASGEKIKCYTDKEGKKSEDCTKDETTFCHIVSVDKEVFSRGCGKCDAPEATRAADGTEYTCIDCKGGECNSATSIVSSMIAISISALVLRAFY